MHFSSFSLCLYSLLGLKHFKAVCKWYKCSGIVLLTDAYSTEMLQQQEDKITWIFQAVCLSLQCMMAWYTSLGSEPLLDLIRVTVIRLFKWKAGLQRQKFLISLALGTWHTALGWQDSAVPVSTFISTSSSCPGTLKTFPSRSPLLEPHMYCSTNHACLAL